MGQTGVSPEGTNLHKETYRSSSHAAAGTTHIGCRTMGLLQVVLSAAVTGSCNTLAANSRSSSGVFAPALRLAYDTMSMKTRIMQRLPLCARWMEKVLSIRERGIWSRAPRGRHAASSQAAVNHVIRAFPSSRKYFHLRLWRIHFRLYTQLFECVKCTWEVTRWEWVSPVVNFKLINCNCLP